MLGLRGPRKATGGTNLAGRVVEVGPTVTGLAVGDDVFGGVMHGAYAEYLSIPEKSSVARVPEGMAYREAAAVHYGGVTALYFLKDRAQLQPGERVLIVGATGGVGRMAVQVAKHLGAHVTGVCGEDAELVRSLGADEIIDYRREHLTEREERWDVVFDTIPGHHFHAYRSALTETARYLSLYATVRLLAQMLITPFQRGPRALAGVALGNCRLTGELAQLASEGAIRPVIARRYPFTQMAEAHAFLESHRPHGSVVVDLGDKTTALRSAERSPQREVA